MQSLSKPVAKALSNCHSRIIWTDLKVKQRRCGSRVKKSKVQIPGQLKTTTPHVVHHSRTNYAYFSPVLSQKTEKVAAFTTLLVEVG